MASRTEEVVLRVSLIADDDATKKVQQLNQQMSQLGQPVQRVTREATKQVGEFEKALGNLARSSLGVTSSLVDLAKVIGPVGAGIALLGVEIVRSIASSKEWARGIIEMGNAARLSGMQPGQFRDLVQQFERAGVSAKNAMATIGPFNRAVAETTEASSGTREALLRLSGQYRDQMADSIRYVATLRTSWERFNAVRHQGENVYNNLRNQGVDETTAREKQLQYLEAYHASWLINVNKDFTAADAAHLQNADRMDAKARELNDALTEEAQTREKIFEATLGWTTDLETNIIKLGNLIETNILNRLEQTTDPFATRQGAGAPARPNQSQSWSQWWQQRTGSGWGGHPAAKPQSIGGESPVFFPEGSLGKGDITQGWRHSENVSDSRDAIAKHIDDISRHGTAVDTSTKEFHQLNQNVQQLIDNGVFGPPVAMAEGGVVSGPVNALVGEAGPEAIVSKGGTSVVNQPTRMMLGTDGAQAVVPLSSAGADIDKTIAGFAKGGERSIMQHDYAASVVENLAGLRNYNAADHERLKKFMATGGEGMEAADQAWCAHTVRTAYRMAGLGGSLAGTTAAASSFNNWQKNVTPEDVQRGDVLTLPGIKGFRTGHVGLALGPYDPKTHTIPFGSGNTAIPGEGWHEGGAAAITNLPVGGTGSNRLLSARRDVPRIELHSPGPAAGSRVAMMAEGGIVAPPFGEGAAGIARGLRSYLEQGGRGVVGDIKSSAANLMEQAQQTIAAPSFAGAGKTALAATGFAGNLLPPGIVAQMAATPGLERLGFGHEAASDITNVGSAVVNPLGLSALSKLYFAGRAGGKIAGSLAGPVSEQIGGATRPMFSGDPADDRVTLDQSGGGGRGGGTTEGTITIEHQETGRSGPRKVPLFRAPHIARQSQMQPAEHGPENHWSNSQDVVH